VALRDEAAAWLARRNAVGPPLRVGMLRQNLRAFAHAEVLGLIKAGVEEKGLLLAREAGLSH
jgi:adenylate cyclase